MQKVWSRDESQERFPQALTPLGWSLLDVPLSATLNQMSHTLGLKKYQRDELVMLHNGYVYTAKDFFKSIKNLRPTWGRQLEIFAAVIRALSISVWPVPRSLNDFKSKFFSKIFIILFETKTEEIVQNWQNKKQVLIGSMSKKIDLPESTLISAESFLKAKSELQETSIHFFAEDFNVYFIKHLLHRLLLSDLKRAGLSTHKALDLLNQLSNGLAENFSTKMIKDFEDPKIDVLQLQEKYGHLTDNWDLYSRIFLEIDEIWSSRKTRISLTRNLEQKNKQAAKDIIEILNKNEYSEKFVIWYQKLILIDEDLRAYSSLQYPEAKRLMQKIATDWLLPLGENLESIYFLNLVEIETALKKRDFTYLKTSIAQRKNEFISNQKKSPPHELMQTRNGFIELHDKKESQIVLRGEVVSSGKKSGVVRIIKDIGHLKNINENSILVIESATPVFAPFYAICGGIVSETGGQLSHGAIVAREYGIPMLTGVKKACVLLKEGQEVVLDAEEGIVIHS